MPTLRDPSSAAAQVRAVLHAVQRRLLVVDVLLGFAIGAAASSIVAVAARTTMATGARRSGAAIAGSIVFAIVTIVTRRRRTTQAAAFALERGYPSLRNLAVTAVELLDRPDRVRPYMWNRVILAAARSLTGIDPARAVPLARNAIAAVALAGVAAAFLTIDRGFVVTGAGIAQRPGPEREALAPGDLTIDIVPPQYAGRADVHLRNPASVEALAGSEATIRVAGRELAVRVNAVPLTASGGAVRTVLAESGSIAIDSGDVRRLLPLTVTPDAAPDVKVSAPGKDLRVADAKATIPIHASAADDIGLRDLELRYTVVSGGGEQFSFKEGTLPADVTRESGRTWTAGASLSLAALKLEPGDALIYRAVARDARPGSIGEGASDTYFVEVAGPGDIALEGIDMPPDRERYALSQAMIVLKIQRLMAREAGLPRAEVEEAAGGIAAEQRAVRANFIFLLGGEVEDEVVEAEASHEIQEGRLANQARREIVAATLAMRKVEQALASVAVRPALPPAQEAVRALQRAFGRNRYLLRALPTRVRLDPSRRLSGDLASARDWARDTAATADDRAAAASSQAVAEAAAVAAAPGAADARLRLERLAEEVLAIAPGDADVQRAARLLLQARDSLAGRDVERTRAALQDAIAPLLVRAQRGRLDVPSVARDAARLAGSAAGGQARR